MKINAAKLNRAIQKGFQQTVEDFAAQCTEEIESEKWQWDGITFRSNGQVVSSPRDIVDNEDLKNSQFIDTESNPARVGYSAEHSEKVHEGSPADNHPDRPFMRSAAMAKNWNKELAKNIEANL